MVGDAATALIAEDAAAKSDRADDGSRVLDKPDEWRAPASM